MEKKPLREPRHPTNNAVKKGKVKMFYKSSTALRMLVASVASFSLTVQAQTLDLREAIQETITTNPRVLSELRQVDARDREIRVAQGGFLPRVDLLAGYGWQERDPAGAITQTGGTRNDLWRHEMQLNASQMVFDGFETLNEYRHQQSRRDSASYQAMAVAESVTLQVVRVYLEVLKQQEIVSLAEATLATHEDIYQRMQRRHDSGVGSRADLDQISGRLALARTNVISARANLQDAQINFQRVVGRFPQGISLTVPGSYRNYLPESVEAAMANATQRHPVLKSASADLEAVSYQYEQTASPFYPRFNVEVERDWNRNIDGIETRIDDLRVMLRMRYNLFNGMSDTARRQQFAHLVEQATEIRNNSHREVEQELRLAWTAYESLANQIATLEQHVNDSEATKAAYTQQFDLGRRTLLDLLNTENEMISARQSLVSAQHDLLYHEYRIFHAMGDLMTVVGVSL